MIEKINPYFGRRNEGRGWNQKKFDILQGKILYPHFIYAS
jgi:hypothetical protein